MISKSKKMSSNIAFKFFRSLLIQWSLTNGGDTNRSIFRFWDMGSFIFLVFGAVST